MRWNTGSGTGRGAHARTHDLRQAEKYAGKAGAIMMNDHCCLFLVELQEVQLVYRPVRGHAEIDACAGGKLALQPSTLG